jgi:DNA-binding FadR family transcriptional regulator
MTQEGVRHTMADDGGRPRGPDWAGIVVDDRSKVERVADALAAKIEADAMDPGSFLGTKTQLRQQLSVSPATLDMALRVLVDRGLVTVRPGVKGGVRVAEPDPSALHLGRARWRLTGSETDAERAGQGLAIYFALQPLIVATAAHALTDADHTRLTDIRDQLHASVGDPRAYFTAHRTVHDALLEATHDEVLISIVGTATALADAGTGGPEPPQGEDVAAYTAERVAVHVDIVEAVLRGDVRAAWLRLRDHGVTQHDIAADSALLPQGFLDLQRFWREVTS